MEEIQIFFFLEIDTNHILYHIKKKYEMLRIQQLQATAHCASFLRFSFIKLSPGRNAINSI